MTEELQSILLFGLAFLTIIFFISTKQKTEPETEHKTEPKTKPKSPPTPEQQSDEILCALNWMLMHGIIDNKQYNELIVKCLPFLE